VTADERLRRAEHARQLLDDPLLMETLAAMRAETIQTWEAAVTTEAREAAWHSVRAVARLEAKLRGLVTDGKLVRQRKDAHDGR
jgi:hypothetical protein